MALVIVDTSIFVEFFRGRDTPVFKELLLNNQILLSNYVRLELLQGVRKQEMNRMEFVLGGLETIPHQENIFTEAENILHQAKGKGLRLGIVDLLIAAESNLMKAPICSLDRVFQSLDSLKLIQIFGTH